MKRFLSIGIFILCGVSIFLLLKRRSLKNPRVGKPKTIQTAAKKLDNTIVKPTKKSQVAAEPKSVKSHTPPVEITFEMKEGLAIAYGDVILGIPEEPVSVGRYRPSRPQLWDSYEIPYAIDQNLSAPERIAPVVDYLAQRTPIRLVEYAEQPDAIVFAPGEDHCYSYLGRVGGLQPIQLSPRCGFQEILHEVLHALGFIHEHSRTDRNQHLTVLFDNIEEAFLLQFQMVPELLMDLSKSYPFDFHSIMLYDPQAFAKEKGLATLEGKNGNQISPVKKGLSRLDIEKLNDIYGD